jgi:hypothetical protein
MEKTVSKRRGRAVIVLLVLVFAVLIVAGLVSALKIGFAAGLASTGGVVIAISPPRPPSTGRA